MIENTELEDRR